MNKAKHESERDAKRQNILIEFHRGWADKQQLKSIGINAGRRFFGGRPVGSTRVNPHNNEISSGDATSGVVRNGAELCCNCSGHSDP